MKGEEIRIKILTTGGTIDKVYFDAMSEYSVGHPQIEEILDQVNISVRCEIEVLLQKDSIDLTDEDRKLIADRVASDSCNRILITHGTDTMVKTALQLEDIPDKTIVMVGSLTPARFKQSDADFNIGFAMGVVQSLAPGVYIAMNGQVFQPSMVRKNRNANRFESLQ